MGLVHPPPPPTDQFGIFTASGLGSIIYRPTIFVMLVNRSPKGEPVMYKVYLKYLIIEVCVCFACSKDCIPRLSLLVLQNKHSFNFLKSGRSGYYIF